MDKSFKIILLITAFMLLPSLAEAQCSMCRAVLETGDSKVTAQGINDGILYLMIFPYLLIGGIAYYFYRLYNKKKSSD